MRRAVAPCIESDGWGLGRLRDYWHPVWKPVTDIIKSTIPAAAAWTGKEEEGRSWGSFFTLHMITLLQKEGELTRKRPNNLIMETYIAGLTFMS